MFGACGLVAAARQAGALRLLLLYPVPEAKTFNMPLDGMLLDGFGDLAEIPHPLPISEDAIFNFLCEFIPRAYLVHNTVTPDRVREALSHDGAVAGTRLEDAKLVGQLERIPAAVEAAEDADEGDDEEACECSEVKVASSDDDEAAEQLAVDETLSGAHPRRACVEALASRPAAAQRADARLGWV